MKVNTAEGAVKRGRPVARQWSTEKRHQSWAVYDLALGGWPQQVPGFGRVAGPFPTEQQAEVEAERLAAFYQTKEK